MPHRFLEAIEDDGYGHSATIGPIGYSQRRIFHDPHGIPLGAHYKGALKSCFSDFLAGSGEPLGSGLKIPLSRDPRGYALEQRPPLESAAIAVGGKDPMLTSIMHDLDQLDASLPGGSGNDPLGVPIDMGGDTTDFGGMPVDDPEVAGVPPGQLDAGPMGLLANPSGMKGGAPDSGMLEYWSVSDGDGHTASVLADGDGHVVIGQDPTQQHHHHHHHHHDDSVAASSSNGTQAKTSEHSHERPSHQDEGKPDENGEESNDHRGGAENKDHGGGGEAGTDDSNSSGTGAGTDDSNSGRTGDSQEGQNKEGHDKKGKKDEPPGGIIIVEKSKDDKLQPTALIGGLLAIFAQAYLWGNVFVTLFKPQRRPQPAGPETGAEGGVPPGGVPPGPMPGGAPQRLPPDDSPNSVGQPIQASPAPEQAASSRSPGAMPGASSAPSPALMASADRFSGASGNPPAGPFSGAAGMPGQTRPVWRPPSNDTSANSTAVSSQR